MPHFASAGVVHRSDELSPLHGWEAIEPGSAGELGDEARQPRMVPKERIDGSVNEAANPGSELRCCNFWRNARGLCCDKPRANHFPSFGGGGPSLNDSLRSSSS
jgi:hypothetical protein